MGILTFRGNWLQKLGFPQRAPFFTGSDCLDNPQRPYNIFFFFILHSFSGLSGQKHLSTTNYSHTGRKSVY